MNFQYYISQIQDYEDRKSKMTNSEFSQMLRYLSQYLSGAHKIRFDKLTFIEDETTILDDDIPF